MARGESKADTNNRNGNTGATVGFEGDLFLADEFDRLAADASRLESELLASED